MSEYVNVGAVDGAGSRIPNKTALRAIVNLAVETSDNELVMFDQTSMIMSGRLPGNITIKDLLESRSDIILNVTGPDPYTSRKWYASVYRKNDGIVVK